ncbi:MAG: hypothetical protein K2L07_08750 [Lachnospiraceae bacterium]|nr:hypothetical protein [Lachnospiraceae bacterium]
MKKSVFDKISDSYENFHLKELRLGDGADVITVSPKLKLGLGWSLFILCCVLAYIFVGLPFVHKTEDISKEDREAVLKENINVDEEHDTIIPYEKDANESLNEFVTTYFKAITSCDYLRLQDMVTDADEYRNDENLKRKAEFITNYENITVYTKAGLNEDSYITFVVANLTIAGVNSSPYDIITLYIVNGERGYMINNGKLPADVKEYIEKVKGDADIQKVYKAVEEENAKLKEKDSSLREFYEIISRRNVETQSAADQTSEEIQGQENASENTEQESNNENASENPDQSNAEEDTPEN